MKRGVGQAISSNSCLYVDMRATESIGYLLFRKKRKHIPESVLN